jgi:hypothetical protein
VIQYSRATTPIAARVAQLAGRLSGAEEENHESKNLLVFLLLALSIIASACTLTASGKPAVTLAVPPK